jgi:hypothetical protein
VDKTAGGQAVFLILLQALTARSLGRCSRRRELRRDAIVVSGDLSQQAKSTEYGVPLTSEAASPPRSPLLLAPGLEQRHDARV